MKKTLAILIPITVIIALILVTINAIPNNQLETPQKIIIYNKGNQITINKNQELFNKIVHIVNENVAESKNIILTKSLMESTDEEYSKSQSTAIEFIYKGKNVSKISLHNKTKLILYSRLLIPLTKEDSREIFWGSEEEYKNSSLKLSQPFELNKIVEEIL